jgi:hypothetical protein
MYQIQSCKQQEVRQESVGRACWPFFIITRTHMQAQPFPARGCASLLGVIGQRCQP